MLLSDMTLCIYIASGFFEKVSKSQFSFVITVLLKNFVTALALERVVLENIFLSF